MPDNEESRKSVAGVVTPNATPDADWRREVAGVFAFAESTGSTQRGPIDSPLMSPVNSPLSLPLVLLGG